MNFRFIRGPEIDLPTHLLLFSLATTIAALAYVPFSPGPLLMDALAVLVPLGVSLGLGLFTLRAQRGELHADETHLVVVYGWAGTFVSATISGLMIALHHLNDVPLGGVVDQLLIVVSVGLGGGVVVGYAVLQNRGGEVPQRRAGRPSPSTDRDREDVLLETTWTTHTGPKPILTATVEALAAHEDVDPLELPPLSNAINPAVFAALRETENSRWQLTFYTDEYEVRVSSLGTITVFSADPSTARPAGPTVNLDEESSSS